MSTLTSAEPFRELGFWRKCFLLFSLLLIGIMASSDVPAPAATNLDKSSLWASYLEEVESLPAVETEFSYLGQGDPNLAIPAQSGELIYLESSRDMNLSMWLNQTRSDHVGEYSFALKVYRVVRFDQGRMQVVEMIDFIRSPLRAPGDVSIHKFDPVDLPPAIYLFQMSVEGEEPVFYFFAEIKGGRNDQRLEALGGRQ